MKYKDSYLSNKSFLSKLLNYIKMQFKIRFLKTPTRMIIFITDRCNAKCEHCFYWKDLNKKNEPTLNEFKKLSSSLPMLDTISLTGGEPFLRKDIFEIIKILSKKTKKIAISTNGSFTDHTYKTVQRVMKELKTFLSVQISIDGIGKAHDKIRGVPLYNKVINTIKKLKTIDNSRFSFNTLTVITNHNYKLISKIAKVLQDEYKINAFFEFVRGDRKNKAVTLPNPDAMEETVKELKKIYLKNKKDPQLLYIDYKMLETELFVHKYNKFKYKCFAGKGTGVIYPDGNISVCELFPAFANLKKYNWNFKKAWFSKEADLERKKVKGCFCTHGCWNFQNILLSPSTMAKYYLSKK